VRLQLQTLVANTTTGVHLPPKYKGPFQTVVTIMEEEGMQAPFKVVFEHFQLFGADAYLVQRSSLLYQDEFDAGAWPCAVACLHRGCRQGCIGSSCSRACGWGCMNPSSGCSTKVCHRLVHVSVLSSCCVERNSKAHVLTSGPFRSNAYQRRCKPPCNREQRLLQQLIVFSSVHVLHCGQKCLQASRGRSRWQPSWARP